MIDFDKLGIWFVEFPLHQYNEDAKELARKNDLRIVDARFDDGSGAKDVPSLTRKGESQAAPVKKVAAKKTAAKKKAAAKKVAASKG